jgi:hypothetical protein
MLKELPRDPNQVGGSSVGQIVVPILEGPCRAEPTMAQVTELIDIVVPTLANVEVRAAALYRSMKDALSWALLGTARVELHLNAFFD